MNTHGTAAGPSRRSYSPEELQEALDIMARIVVKYGDVYLPIYERLERELDAAVARELTLERVRTRAKNAQQLRNNRVTSERPSAAALPLSA